MGRRFGLLSIAALVTTLLLVQATTVQADSDKPGPGAIKVEGGLLGGITTSPLTLTPAFSPTITDYVLRCQSGVNTVQFTLSARFGSRIKVDDNRAQSVVVQRDLVENQAVVFSAVAGGVPDQESSGSEEHDGGRVDYWIRCLPHDFPQLSVNRPGNPPPGWYLTGNVNSVAGSGAYAMALDNNGTPVWYHKTLGQALNITPISKDTIAWMSNAGPGFGIDPGGAFQEYNLASGTSHWLSAPVVPTDFHELDVIGGGHVMMLSSPLTSPVDMSAFGGAPDATIVDCVVQEVGTNGQLVWRWRASDHIGVTESTHPFAFNLQGQTVWDVYHCNSVDADPLTGDLLLSTRATDAVYRIDKATGKILWKLGGRSYSRDGAEILQIRGDPEGMFHAQHDARFQPGGDVSLYDDQSWDGTLAARGVEYHVDPSGGTARLVWSFQSPDAHNSGATGSFRRLHDGTDNVIGWGAKRYSLFTEVDSVGQVLLEVTFPSGEFAYRVVKVNTDRFSKDLLRANAGQTG